MQSTLSSPVNYAERAAILDVLRGFAVLGILIDNMYGFTGYGYFSMSRMQALPTFHIDAFLSIIELAFVRGKFYSLFSLLFGIGFSIILIRNQQKGINPLKIFYRRLLILMVIGAIHLLLVWEGDILFLYGVIGLALPLFRNCSDKTLLIWAVVLIASPIIIDVIKIIFHFKIAGFLESMAQTVDQKTGIPLSADYAVYLFKDGSGWQEWRNWLQSGWLYRYSFLLESNRIPKVLGMFLLGLYAGKNMIYANLAQNISLFKVVRKWGFIIGIPSSIAMAIFEIDSFSVPNVMGLLDTLSYTFSVVPLTLAYVATICLFWVKTKGQNKWIYFAPVGRMALTNYIMHSVICISLCYGLGLGLGAKIGPAVYIPLALAIYALQVIYSNWWFKHFNYGPIEWVWRQLTYGKQLRIKKES